MSPMLKKEMRLLAPAWLGALLLTVLPVLLGALSPEVKSSMSGLAIAGFGLGLVALAVVPIGREVTCRTMCSLLALPVERSRLWNVKVVLLGAAVLSVFAALLIAFPFMAESHVKEIRLAALLVLSVAGAVASTGLWTTVLLRQIAASMCFTVMVPALLMVITFTIAERTYGPAADSAIMRAMCLALTAYAVISMVVARRLFLRAEDVPWTGGILQWPSWLRARRSAEERSTQYRVSTPWRALVRKEIALQRSTLVMAACAALLHLSTAALRAVGAFDRFPKDSSLFILLDGVAFLWLFVPLLAGAVAVAEERRMGTIDSQLCLPVSARKQFLLKLGVVVLFALVFGAIAPVLIEPVRRDNIYILCLASVFIGIIALLASTLTRGLTEALSASLGLGILLGLIRSFGASPPYIGDFLWPAELVMLLGTPIIVLALLWPAARNWRVVHITAGHWVRTVATIVGFSVCVVCLASAAYFRPWEFLSPMEPAHGTPRFSAEAPPKVAAGGWLVTVLYPDGRLWLSTDGEVDRFPSFLSEHWHRFFVVRKRVSQFAPGSNWIAAAATLQRGVAVQSDGTLWETQYAFPDKPAPMVLRRKGDGTNWASVSGGPSHFLALQTDGTLWAWGSAYGGQLGLGKPAPVAAGRNRRARRPSELVDTPTQVGSDSDWAAAFAVGGWSSIAYKKDGSAWCWGLGATNLMGAASDPFTPQPSPILPREIPWKIQTGGNEVTALIRSNGTLLVWGDRFPAALFHAPSSPNGTLRLFPPVALATNHLWKGVAVLERGSREIAVLERDGHLWRWSYAWTQQLGSFYKFHRVGRHGDWLALDRLRGGTVTVAADGSVWLWDDSYHSWSFRNRNKPVKLATLW